MERRKKGGFNGGKMKCKFSSIMKTEGVRKNSAPLCDYRKAEDAGLSFLPIHIKSHKM
jgi:hypothetical protein